MSLSSSGIARPGRDSRSSTSERDVGLISARYRVVAPLGEGGMASVFAVCDQETDKKLALKRLSNAANQKLLALFEREFHTLKSLRHPAIVEAYDYGSDADGPYYTMELLEGSDISTLAPKPWPEVCKILRDVASGIALLHARKLIHRDLSARNVWLDPDGRVKLIDFGTMASFGRPDDVVGTPPFVAPEALRGLELDQRTDLYSLGALTYFLLTGRHAFPARSLAALEDMWKDRPRPASKRVSELGREDLPEIPAALDGLVESLLVQDPLARPKSAAELIDRLTVIASLERERPVHLVETYFSAPTFVGRGAERAALRAAYEAAVAGRAQNVMLEATSGLGKSRLLNEFSLEVRLLGATVLQAEARAGANTHEAALQLSLRLLTALPAEARAAAEPYAATLGHLSPQLRERLGLGTHELAAMPRAHGEARMRVQAALRDWFLSVAQSRPLVISADDVHAFDDGSAAWLAALRLEAKAHKLLIVSSLASDRLTFSAAVQALRQNAIQLELAPLSHAETLELFRSVFGAVPYLARLVDRIHQRSDGNPGHALDLAEHLSRDGVVSYADGSWLLPPDLAEAALPLNRADAELARLARLSTEVRNLGQMLSVREGVMPLPMCAAIAGVEGRTLLAGLDALVRTGVLARSSEGYAFARESLRLALHAELAPDLKKQAHRRLGRLLLSARDLTELERLKAGVHLLLGGDEEEGSCAVALAGRHYGLVDLADLGPAAPSLELALAHFRDTNRSPYELASLLPPLALAGYYADKRLAVRHGMDAVMLLKRLVGLSLASRLQRFIGKKLGLFLALGIAAVGFALRARNNPRVPKFREAMMMLFNCVAALTGASIICLDLPAARRYARLLEPMTALGPNHVATFMYQFCQNLKATIQDHPADSRSRWIRMIEQLDQPEVVHALDNVHALYLAGALYARGAGECRRDDSAALACADRLEAFGLKLYDMSADQVRMMYHANRGDLEAFQRYTERVEVHAIARGTAWQVETWIHSGLSYVHLRNGDVAGLKECVEQLKRLSAEVPSLAPEHARALAAYLVLRGTPHEALRVMDENPELPCEMIGWARCEGVRARAYNDLGEHERARETCLRTLEYLTDEDLAFCGYNLGLLIELARAEAGLGEYDAAEARLQELFERHRDAANPVTMGALHEGLAEVAACRADSEALKQHIREVEHWFRPTRHPALVARCERLLKQLGHESDEEGHELDAGAPHLVTVLHNLRHGGDSSSLAGSARWILKQLSGLTAEAHLFVRGDDDTVSCIGSTRSAAPEALQAWVEEELRSLGEEMATRTIGLDEQAPLDRSVRQIGDEAYRLVFLRAGLEDEPVVGALVVPNGTVIPHPVVREMAARMQASVSVHTTV